MAEAGLTFDPDRSVEQRFCATCADYTLVKGFILRDECAGGVYFAALHDHDGPEAWIDVILGTFERADFSDHVTFGYRIRESPSKNQRATALVSAAQSYGPSPIFGRKLSRHEAVSHPLLNVFWELVDFVLQTDPDVQKHIGG